MKARGGFVDLGMNGLARGEVVDVDVDAEGVRGVTLGGFFIIRFPVAPVSRSVTPTEPRNTRVAFFRQSNLGSASSGLEPTSAGMEGLPAPSCDIGVGCGRRARCRGGLVYYRDRGNCSHHYSANLLLSLARPIIQHQLRDSSNMAAEISNGAATSSTSGSRPVKKARQAEKASRDRRLFTPFRALGVISNHVPLALQTRSAKNVDKPVVNVVTSLGKSWAMWDAAGSLRLLFVGEWA